MRHIGIIEDPQLKQRFLAFLAQQDVRTTVFVEQAGWSIWADEENKIELARDAFRAFEEDPLAECFLAAEAEWAKYESDEPSDSPGVETGQLAPTTNAGTDEAGRGSLSGLTRLRRERRPYRLRRGYTLSIVFLSLIGAVLIDFNLTSPAGRWMAFCDSPPDMHGFDTLKNILAGQLWRLVSPSFAYTDFHHLLFGVIFLYHFGTRIESLRGPFVLGLLVLGGASFSNIAQALAPAHVSIEGLEGLAGGAEFAGMSGVVFGLFGFTWAQSVRFPRNALRMDTVTIIVVVAWQAVCIASPEWGFANVGHLAGLIYGIAAGSFYGTASVRPASVE